APHWSSIPSISITQRRAASPAWLARRPRASRCSLNPDRSSSSPARWRCSISATPRCYRCLAKRWSHAAPAIRAPLPPRPSWWRSSPWSRWHSSRRGSPRAEGTGSVLALVALPIRGVIAATVADSWGLVPVQILDGVGAGLLGVATPGLVARILAGTGHVNAGLGAVMTLQGVGAASSPVLAGLVAQQLGYSAAFLALGGIAAIAFALWLVATPIFGPACRNHL